MSDKLFNFVKFLINIFIGNFVIRILETQLLKTNCHNDFVSITELHNSGVAFSLFSSFTTCIIVFTVIFIIVFLYFYYKNSKTISNFDNLAYTLLLTGVIANLHQRIIFKYVVDYIQLNFIKFPVFNLADVFITVGILILFINICFETKKVR